MKFETDKYIKVFDNNGDFNIGLEGEDYEFGFLEKLSPVEYSITILKK